MDGKKSFLLPPVETTPTNTIMPSFTERKAQLEAARAERERQALEEFEEIRELEECKVAIPRGTGRSYAICWRSGMRVTGETKVTDGRKDE